MKDDLGPVIIKKYANRRLYNTETSVYITLEDVREMVKEGIDFEVRDAKTNNDLTRQILTQIIFEQELNGNSVLPVGFLKRMIEMCDDKISELIPAYLESSMDAFAANQENIRKTWDEYNPMAQIEEATRQNVELMSQAFNMFNPFESMFGGDSDTDAKGKKKTG